MKKIIGIVPASFILDPEKSSMEDDYVLKNNYIKRTLEAGCVPVGLAPVDNWLPEEALEMCDGFLVQGGGAFYPYHYQVLHHAITHGKRYLGICLGQQIIYVYFELKKRVEALGYGEDIPRAIWRYRSEQPADFTIQEAVSNHRSPFSRRGQEDDAKHDVDIVPGTLLHRVMGRDTMRVSSYHSLNTPPWQTLVPINSWSATGDGVVEGTEYGENILGVQGHPEMDDTLPELFRFLAGE